ncbi:MAG: 3-dehydroquinate synthase, partial [Clostridia bacterium]|nr:3-dehydroquinate synthase [Clostridia bacterium]
MMKTVTVHASRTYDVRVGSGLLAQAGETLRALGAGEKVMLVSDSNVFPLYGSAAEGALESTGFTVTPFVIPAGETSKNLENYGALLNAMCEAGLSRSDTVVALGGGVVGDLAGFAAATYQRGTGLVQLPTSLLAAVDSSVGGKTAVDLPAGKNQVGCFYQPQAVLCDVDTFATLPEAEVSNGCAEIVKYAMIADADLFARLEGAPVRENYEEIVARCVAIKRDYVEADEKDNGLRMMLNFGHTVGHAVEAVSGYAIPHGQAVAIGMVAITRAAAQQGDCAPEVAERLTALLKAAGLPTEL